MWVAMAATFAACGTSRPPRTTNLTDQARTHYVEGMDELLSGNYVEAVEQFQLVTKNPGYIGFAALARLRIGDALFLQEKYDAAIETYRAFLKQYEGNPNTGYARFRIGHAFYEQIPSEWFLAPPVYERQQTQVVHAARELRRFIELHPADTLVPQAQAMLDDCEAKLYEHERFVADFYRDRDKPAGVVQRLETALRKYPDHAATEENFLLLAKAYAQTRKLEKAAAMYQAYLDRFPSGKHRDEAAESLRVLKSAPGGGDS